ncbi:hypothetical protein DFH27DRAFT_99749 [Peziza echinospora]|nr:hypothetical protein DFH27DRAFT_99749 [Peziza echinospora]
MRFASRGRSRCLLTLPMFSAQGVDQGSSYLVSHSAYRGSVDSHIENIAVRTRTWCSLITWWFLDDEFATTLSATTHLRLLRPSAWVGFRWARDYLVL